MAKTLAFCLVNQSPLQALIPVCPDYGSSDPYYQQMGSALSKEAEAGVRATESLKTTFGQLVNPIILVADTETDIPEVIDRCGQGKIETYQDACQNSVCSIISRIEDVSVTTFTDFFGDRFHQQQYQYETFIRGLMNEKEEFRSMIQEVSEQRREKYRKILGRGEQDNELTVRYMAQYAAFGSITRELYPHNGFIVNYPTPNRPYYNFATRLGATLYEKDFTVIPVLGSVLQK